MSEETIYQLPSDAKQRSVFEMVQSQGTKTSRTPRETQEFYSSWAKNYDSDQAVLQHNSYNQLISTLAEIAPLHCDNGYKNLYFLDMASGTTKN
uniref:Uncharacterized protein n=1 Tax=Ciona savignyi TaxID=51511 RepID=H2YZW7_CIOSA